MSIIDITVAQVAPPAVGSGPELDREALAWVVTACTLCFGGLMVLGGRLADTLGARRTLLAGPAVFPVASLLRGPASTGLTAVGTAPMTRISPDSNAYATLPQALSARSQPGVRRPSRPSRYPVASRLPPPPSVAGRRARDMPRPTPADQTRTTSYPVSSMVSMMTALSMGLSVVTVT